MDGHPNISMPSPPPPPNPRAFPAHPFPFPVNANRMQDMQNNPAALTNQHVPENHANQAGSSNTAATAARAAPDNNPLVEHVLTTLSSSVTAASHLLQTAQGPTLDRIQATMAPLQGWYNMRLLTYIHDLEQQQRERNDQDAELARAVRQRDLALRELTDQHHDHQLQLQRQRAGQAEEELAERTQELEWSQDELFRMRDRWVDDHHLIGELRAALNRATDESDVRYRENLANLRAGSIREAALKKRVAELEQQVERLGGGGGEDELAAQQPIVDEEMGGAEEEEGEGENELASGHRQQQHHEVQDDNDDDDERSLRSVKRRKTAAAAQIPRVRSLFTTLNHQFDSPDFAAAAGGRLFLLDRHSEREQVVDQLASTFEPVPAAVAAAAAAADAATTSQLATTLQQARDFLLARMQLKVDVGHVVVDLVPAEVPAVRALDNHLADIICDQERARRSMRWVEGDVFPDYCFRGAIVARRKPNFDQGEGRACKECRGSGKPCIVRRGGQLVALPKKNPEERDWKDAEMWVGVHGEGWGGRRKKRKN
ncbi:hypothetical protein DBV05_g2733 [Lasiodiplodia theobromae]|uniref:Uncharacterized protein n=1 Tax=Lasiodiplodia theobromae TaxID=45133 RepID=A0A5N5DKR7_9PEZI|nr:hypothetical protein DBV05_g2733 [Lasiodiplodia theobromae]